MTASFKLNYNGETGVNHHAPIGAEGEKKKTYPMIEAGMISLGKRNYKLPCTLVASVDPHTLVRQALRTHERDELEEKVRLRFEQVRGLFLNSRLEFLGVIPRDSIPGLCFTPVHFVRERSDDKSNHTGGVVCGDILTKIHRVGVVVLSYQYNQLKTTVNARGVAHLIMPTKRGEYHTDIRPWYGHARYVRLDISKKRVGKYWNVVQVP